MRVHSFHRVARDYMAKVTPHRHAHYQTLMHELKLRGDEKLLDVGCGPGIIALEAARRLPQGHLTGIDISSNMIELAKGLAAEDGATNVSFQVGDALNLDFPDNSFDVVISSLVFPWVPDQKRHLAEIHRVLKPGGRLGLVTLSKIVYREFIGALRHAARRNPDLLPIEKDFYRFLGAKVYNLKGAEDELRRAGMEVRRSFRLTTEDPVTPQDYLTRINSIVDENYLEGLSEEDKARVRQDIFLALARRNGSLHFTESALFLLAEKKLDSARC